MPTMLDIFNLPLPPEVQGRSLLPLLSADDPGRAQGGCIFGQFGAAINFTLSRSWTYRSRHDGTLTSQASRYALVSVGGAVRTPRR